MLWGCTINAIVSEVLAFDVRYSRSSDRHRIVVCNVRLSVPESVASNKVLVIVVLVKNVV